MNEDGLREQLTAYRDATGGLAPPATLVPDILAKVPRRARARRFVRDAQAAVVVAAVVGAGGGVWAAVETTRVQRQLGVQVSAWADGP
jgi:hypothetical protein